MLLWIEGCWETYEDQGEWEELGGANEKTAQKKEGTALLRDSIYWKAAKKKGKEKHGVLLL